MDSRSSEGRGALVVDRPILYLSYLDVRELLDPRVVAQLAEQALLASSQGGVALPNPDMLELRAPQVGIRYVMKAVTLLDRGITGFRITSLAGGPESQDRPSRFVMLHDMLTGHFLALIDEEWSYALRMGAGAVVAAKYLVSQGKKSVAVVGTGSIAQGAVFAVVNLLSVHEVRLTGGSPESLERCAAALREEHGLEVHPTPDAEEAVRGADIVIIAGLSRAEDVVRAAWLSPGTVVCAIGNGFHVEPEVYQLCRRVVVDDWSQAQRKGDALLLSLGDPQGERSLHHLAEVITGECERTAPDEVVFVRTYGLTAQDVAICHWLYEEALMRGLGTQLPSRPRSEGVEQV